MSLSAVALQKMLEMGLTLEQVVDLASTLEADKALSKGAIRQREWRARRDVSGDVTRDVSDPLPLSPSPQTPQPHTPAPVDITTRAKAAVSVGDFDVWYASYPHKVGKGAAQRAFARAIAKTPLADLIDGLARYVFDKPPDRSWCNPATWLNEQRWLDQPADPLSPTGPNERSRQPTNNRAAGRGDWSEILAEHDGPPTRDLARTG